MKKVITPAKTGTIGKDIEKVIEKPRPVPTAVTRQNFNTDEEYNAFLEFTKPIVIRKLPKMPFKDFGDYLKEYNLILNHQSTLTATQRIVVKNVINDQIRKGNIQLTKV